MTLDAESASSNFSSLFWACLFSGMCITYWNIAKEQNLLFIFSKTTVWAYRGDMGFLWIISCSFLVCFFLLVPCFSMTFIKQRELFGLCKNPHRGTRLFVYPARCVGCCDLNIDCKEHKNVNKHCTCVRDNNRTISDVVSGDLEGSYLNTLTAYKHKVVVLITKETSAQSLCPILTLGLQRMDRSKQAQAACTKPSQMSVCWAPISSTPLWFKKNAEARQEIGRIIPIM